MMKFYVILDVLDTINDCRAKFIEAEQIDQIIVLQLSQILL